MASDEQEAPHGQVLQFKDSTLLLQHGLARYFNKRLFSDITVIAPDGRSIMCHQVVLSAGSKRFANMLEQGNLHGEELPVWGVDSDALEAIIQFFYSGECELSYPSAVAVLDAATRLDVPVLAAAADSFIHQVLHPTTVTSILGQALQFKMNDLANTCYDFINNRFEDVAGTTDFTSASFQTLSQVITHVTDHQSELALFKAAWCWIIADVKHVHHLEAILRMIKVPGISFNELIQLGNKGEATNEQLAAAAAAAAAAVGGETGDGGALSLEQLQAAAVQGLKDPDAAAAAEPGSLHPAVAGALDAAAAAAAGDQAAAGGQQQQGWQGMTVTTSSAPIVASYAAGEGLELGQHGAADQMAVAAAGTDDTNLLAALAAGGNLLSPSAGSSLPAGTLNPALGGYESALPTPSSRVPQLDMSMPHGGRYSSNEVHDYAVAAAAYGGLTGTEADAAALAAGADPRRLVSRYNSGQVDEAGAMAGGATSSGGRSGSPTYNARGSRGQGGMCAGSGRAAPKGVCQVEGCYADLKGLRDYHLRYKICEYHLKVSSIVRDGKPQRFCQQCGRFHLLTDFDGNKRSCRARLQRHNARRRKRGEEDAVTFTPTGKRTRGASSSQMTDEDMMALAQQGMNGTGMPMGMDMSGAVPGGAWAGMDQSGNAAYMAAMGMPGFGPGGYEAQAGFGAAAGAAAADGSNWMGQYAGQFGSMPGMQGSMPGLPDGSGGAGSGIGVGGASGGARSGGYGSRRSSRGIAGSRPGSATGHRKGTAAAVAAAAAAAAAGDDTDEDGGNAQMRGWAAGLEMLADVAQLGNHTASDPGEAPAGAKRDGSEPGTGKAEAVQQPQQQPAEDSVGIAAAAPAPAEEAIAATMDSQVQPDSVLKAEVPPENQVGGNQVQQQGQDEQMQQAPEQAQQQSAQAADVQVDAAAQAAGAVAAATAGNGGGGGSSGGDASVEQAAAAASVSHQSPSPSAVGLFAGRSSPPQDAHPTSDSAAVSSGKGADSSMAGSLPGRCDDQAYLADAAGAGASAAAAAAAPARVKG